MLKMEEFPHLCMSEGKKSRRGEKEGKNGGSVDGLWVYGNRWNAIAYNGQSLPSKQFSAQPFLHPFPSLYQLPHTLAPRNEEEKEGTKMREEAKRVWQGFPRRALRSSPLTTLHSSLTPTPLLFYLSSSHSSSSFAKFHPRLQQKKKKTNTKKTKLENETNKEKRIWEENGMSGRKRVKSIPFINCVRVAIEGGNGLWVCSYYFLLFLFFLLHTMLKSVGIPNIDWTLQTSTSRMSILWLWFHSTKTWTFKYF